METYIGVVTHYFNNLGVAVLSLNHEMHIKDVIHIFGHTTDFCQETLSLEFNHHEVEVGKPGEEIALKVIGAVRSGDKVFLAPEALPTQPEEMQQQWPDEWER